MAKLQDSEIREALTRLPGWEWTHDEGGVTQKDLDLARVIEQLRLQVGG
jgi:pterin-4a-carbinolamine dehydratase